MSVARTRTPGDAGTRACRLLTDLTNPVDPISHRLPLEQVLDGIGIVSRGEAITVTILP
jgi:L-iditol 2-dehydrogenase